MSLSYFANRQAQPSLFFSTAKCELRAWSGLFENAGIKVITVGILFISCYLSR